MFIESKVTVPALGDRPEIIDIAGVSVKTFGVGGYESIDSRPQFSFETEGNERQRIFEGGTYQNDKGKFNQLLLHGSATAEGDELYFYITPACLEPDIDSIFANQQLSTFGDQQSEQIAGTTIFSFASIAIQNDNGILPKAVYIGALDFDLRYAHNVNPSASTGFILTAGADPIKLEGSNLLKNMRFSNLSTGGGADGTLTYFFEY